MKDTIAVILAAGRGTRMKSDIPKVLHKILGKPIISYILDSLKGAGIKDIFTVIGFGSDSLKKALKDTDIVIQKKLLGSGDAVKAAKKVLGRKAKNILVICGDTPLIEDKTIRDIIARHKSSGASVTLLTAKPKDLKSYGRIIRSGGRIVGIAEEENIGSQHEAIKEVNVGTYCFKTDRLFAVLEKVKFDNKKNEIFLTDTVGILCDEGDRIESVTLENPEEMIGINTRSDLAEATTSLKNIILKKHMLNGVTIEDPLSTIIAPGARIGRDTVIYSNTVIENDVEIGSSCHIGPFSRIRPGSRMENNAEVGNFVELVRTKVGEHTKVKHHTYLGDTTVGKNVNIGAGTITANYDGKNKNKTVIEDGAFIGVGSILIAPVRIGKKAVVGAGAVVTRNHNVPKGATVAGVPAKVFQKQKRG